ncbi:deubiquitinating protein VCPIP1-like isoform X3 [Littorina saxatilis]
MEVSDSNEPSSRGFLYSGNCPDPSCQTKLTCWSTYSTVECSGCGQRHDVKALQNLKQEKEDAYNTALYTIKSIIAGIKPEPGTDNIKVYGLSNYKCKLLSPLLSQYGMEKGTGRAKLLTEMGQPPVFDCGVLCDRAFCIDPEHINVPGYGRDTSGSAEYLKDTLNIAMDMNENEERLVPIHVDGDGHCLVHAISRALVGRELFYHPLRLNLMNHFRDNLDRYKNLFEDFVDVDEWEDIISECDPDFIPKEGESVGLRNIHIFGLANVLKRPILLLDSPKGIESSGDYSGVFLPAFQTPEQCKNKTGVLNYPLCVAWSSQGRNHFIPLVGVKGKPSPRLPRFMLQTTWGVQDPTLLDAYINFENGCCTVGGSRMLQESYIQRLVSAMEEVFTEKHGVHPDLVADVHRYIFRSKGYSGLPDYVTKEAHRLVKEKSLLICLCCGCLTALNVEKDMLRKGGELYNLACKELGDLKPKKLYIFKENQLSCQYDPDKDELVPDISQHVCPFCKSENKFRHVQADGSVEYSDGDVTREPAGPKSKCSCGFKHYYGGKYYDNRPRELQVPLEWGGKKVVEVVQWWENESDPQLNSNAYQEAQTLIQKHFPGEFGIELLEQKIVAAILRLTAIKEEKDTAAVCDGAEPQKWNAEEASKIILSGMQTQSIHKEELSQSETERQVKKKITANAPQQQARKSSDGSAGMRKGSASNSPARTVSSKDKGTGDKPPSPLSGSPTAAPKPTSPPSTHKANEKKVRIVSADGHSETVTLTEDLTFSQLQEVVHKATHVRPEHQKLRLGFPPKVMAPPAPGQEDAIVPLNHGDKINVERTASEGSSRQSRSPRGSVRRQFDDRMPNEEAMLNTLAARNSGDVIDGSLISMGLLAAQMGADLWGLVQNQPHHFSVGGVYYRQAQRDVGLEPDKHCTFPTLPDKTFCYNAALDRLELCLGELGHFEVEPGIERKAENRQVQGHKHHGHSSHHASGSASSSGSGAYRRDDSSSVATFGTSGAVSKNHTSQKVFEGQGHTLRDASLDTKMPEDVPLTENIRGAARRLQHFCDPVHGQSSIDEEPEGMEVAEVKASATGGQGEGMPQAKYTRKGPGYSVLEPKHRPAQTMEEMQKLFQNLEDVIAASEQMEAEEEGGAGEGAAQREEKRQQEDVKAEVMETT